MLLFWQLDDESIFFTIKTGISIEKQVHYRSAFTVEEAKF